MIVLDTTVLVYATGAEHPFRDPCRGLIEAIGDDRLQATTTPEVIQEFMHVRARRRSRREAAVLGREYADLLSPLVAVTPEALHRGISMFEKNQRLGTFDAVLAAAALIASADALVSADTAFASVGDLNHVVPDAAGVGQLLS